MYRSGRVRFAVLTSFCVAGVSLATAGPRAAEDAPVEAPQKATDAQPAAKEKGDSHKNEIVAEIVLTGSYPEGAQLPGLFGSLTESRSDALKRLRQAARDERISSVLLRFDTPGELSLDWSTAYAFRQAIDQVQEAGKPVYAWLSMAGGPAYMVAASCDKVYMPPSGALMVLGLRAEVMFYKNLLDKLDIEAEMLKIGKFKSAAEPYTRTKMSKAFRTEMEELLDDLYKEMVTAIATGRDLDPKTVQEAVNDAPLSAGAALKRGFIDGLAYSDEVDKHIAADRNIDDADIARDYAEEQTTTDFSGLQGFLKLMEMMVGNQGTRTTTSGPTIAIVYASGVIVTGESESGLLGGASLGSETLSEAIEKASENEDVKAIVLRVNSPGGSALASDLIWRSVQLAKKEKPVLVSMGSVAASGGYYIAMGADWIVAEPTTITGSIGVIGGKLAFEGLFDKIGITISVVSRGANSGISSLTSEFSKSARKAMKTLLKDVYDEFTKKAAQGRDMPLEKLVGYAGGRVYSGLRAEQIGLVDDIGSLRDTIEAAKKRARKQGLLDEGQDVEILRLPKAKSPFEQLFGPVQTQASQRQTPRWARLLSKLDPRLGQIATGVRFIQLLANEPALLMMPYQIRLR